MLNVLIIQHHHHKRNCNTVICSERCAVCRKHAVFEHKVNPLCLKIMLYPYAFIAHHIDMSLQHDRLFVLCAFAAVFLDNNVITVVLVYPETSVFCKLYKEVADSLLIS